ncbi:MAG: 3'-5' exonuclease [Bacteroidetes bacterium]|nr:MAG: 3'-5' exonuclease [Bacteroidota bacterium]
MANIGSILFLDVETVSGKATYGELDETFQELWKLKSRSVLRKYDEPITDEEATEAYTDRAGIFAEFGKIICISVGLVYRDKESKKLSVRLKSFADDDEKKLLEDFSELLNQHYNNPAKHGLCGHNIKEFDVPYICRRMLINQLPLPAMLDIAGKKPWETKHLIDTLEFWKFGDFKNYTSLKLLAAVFGFPSPKDDIDGSEVGRVYWEEKDLKRIAKYCEKDVLATVQLYLKYKLMPLLEDDNILFVE